MKTITFIFLAVFSQFTLQSQWQQTASTPQGAGVTDMVVLNDGTLIATTASFNWPNGQPGGIKRSTDGGATWQNVVDVFNGRTLHLGSTGKIFASYWPFPSTEGMYVSSNGGLNWTQSYPGYANDNVFSITSKNNDNTIFIGTRYGVSRSTNSGANWIFVSSGIPSNTFVYDLDIDETGYYIAAGTSKGAYVSSNNGTSWLAVSGIPITDTIYSVQFASLPGDGEEHALYSGSAGGKLYKGDGEAQFVIAAIVYTFLGRLGDIEVVDNGTFHRILAYVSPFGFDMIDAGFAYSTDGGISWNQNNSGLPSSPKLSASTFQIQGGNIKYYAGLFENTSGGAKVYAMTSSIGIQQISSEVPSGFSLSQNYPNPFNPATNIEFDIPEASFVKLIVYDILGREVTILVNEQLSAGKYKVDWNASIYPSGIYFCKFMTEGFSNVRKMVLSK
jgi:photosystem II stability/assembly factor-like uncharacterized protein